MKKLMTLGLFICAFLIAAPSVSAQTAHQKVYLKAAKNETAKLGEKLNLDKKQKEQVQRYIYDYHMRMDQRANPTKYSKPLSKEEINKRLDSRIERVLTAKQLSQFKEKKTGLLKIEYRKQKQRKMKTGR